MSVVFPINANDRYEEYTASAAQTVFAVPFPFQDDRDITIVKVAVADGAEATLTIATHYTLTGKGTPGPGSLTLVTPAAAGDKIRVIGKAILDRLTSIVQNGMNSSAAQDAEHDRHRLVQQELTRQTDRALKSDFGQAGLTIDTTALTEGRTMVRGPGDTLVAGPTTTEIANAQGYAESAAEDAERAETALAGVTELLNGIVAPKATVAAAMADDPDIDPDYYDIAFYDTDYVAGSGGKYRKRASEPAGDAKFPNANGTWYERHEGQITPQAIDASDVSVAAEDAAGLPVFLDNTARTTTSLDMPTKVYGPGADNVIFDYMPHPIGAAWEDRSRFSSGAQARAAEKMASADVPSRRFTTVAATVDVASTTWAPVTFTLLRDAIGAFSSGLPAGLFPGRKGVYEIRGSVSWETENTGVRIAALTLNGSADVNVIDQQNDPAVVGIETKQVLAFEEEITATDYLGLRLWHSGTGTLTATVRLTVEALYQEPLHAPGSRIGLTAGPWAAIEAQYGGVEGLAQHIAANYDVLVACNILGSNDGDENYPQTPNKTYFNCLGAWGNSIAYDVGYRIHDAVADRMVICEVAHTSPGSGTFAEYFAANPTHWRVALPLDFAQVASAHYENFPRVMRRVKALRPEFEFFAYISASIDALYTNHIGQPWSAYDGSRGIFNVQQYADRYDRMLPELDGYFFDFFNAACINAVVRDQILQLTKARGKKAACNLLSISAASLRFMAESPNAGCGDAALNEGFLYDSGILVEAETDEYLAELAKHRVRGIRNFAFAEEVSAAAVIPGSVIDIASRAKFNSAFVRGDAYGHSWNSYTIL